MRNSGWARPPLGWLLALALFGVVFLWQLPQGRSPARLPSAPVPQAGAPSTVSAPEPLVRGERLPLPDKEPTALDELTGHLVVRVVVPGGTERGGSAQIEVRNASGALRATLELSAANPSVELDCAAGEYELALAHPVPPALGALPERIVLKPGATQSVNFTLTALTRLRGRLTDERELGIEDVRVALDRGEHPVSATRTQASGSFAFDPLPAGSYALVVGDPLGPLLPRRILLLDEQLGEQELRVPVLLELEVRVFDESGFPVDGAVVEGLGESGGRVAGTTDSDGRLQATLLPPGNYRIFARHPTLGRGNRILALTNADDAPVEIQLLSPRSQR